MVETVIDRRNQALGGQKNQRSLSSVTDIGVHWSGVANGTIEGHERHWKDTLGWGTGGYHFSIKRDGIILWNYNLERITNGVGGHNSTSVHVMYEGGKGAPMNEVQKKSLKYVINTLMKPKLPNLKRVRGHNEFPNTSKHNHSSNDCPGINMNDFRAFLDDDKVKPSEPPKTAPSAPKNYLYGAKLVKNEKAKYTVTASDGIKVRNAPSTKATHTGTLKKGQSINYDQVYEGDGCRWLAYTGNSGKRLYLPYRPLSGTNEQWGYFGSAPTNKPTPTPKPAPVKPKENLKVDGYLGVETIKALQRYFGTTVDGIISKPSMVVRALQGKVGAKVDGYWGTETTRKLQQYLGTPVDGVISSPSMVIEELQHRLNLGTF